MNMRKIYRQVARKHGVSISEVKKEMQHVLNVTFSTPVNDGVTELYRSKIPRKADVPTPQEFLTYCISETGRRTKK